MDKNILNPEVIFRNYMVDEKPENYRRRLGIITDFEFEAADAFCKEYNLIVRFNVYKNEKVQSEEIKIENIFVSGRCEFQEFVDDFELWNDKPKEKPSIKIYDILGRYCLIMYDRYDRIRGISSFTCNKANKKHKKIADMLQENTKIEYYDDTESLPHSIIVYQHIPMTTPCDFYKADFIYHCIIKKIECISSENDKVNVRIDTYCFNGSTVRDCSMFINDIFGAGKEQMDKFILDFELEDTDGNIHLKLAERLLCICVLYENSRGNLYISDIEPIWDKSDEEIKQYVRVLRKFLK